MALVGTVDPGPSGSHDGWTCRDRGFCFPKQRFHGAEAAVVIAADDDHGRETNVGLTKAREAAQAVGGRTIEPPLTKAERAKGLTDFNDLAASRGKEAFRALVRGLVEAGRARAPQRNQGRAPERALSM